VHPGIVRTALSTLGEAAKDTGECQNEIIERVLQTDILIQERLPAGLNLYLASPRADFLRGRYTTANWDVDELEAHKAEIVQKNLLRADLVASYGPSGYQWQDAE
jgi:hypothetical protein